MVMAALAPVLAFGARMAATPVGQALVGTPLRALFTGLGVGHFLGGRSGQQVQQYRR